MATRSRKTSTTKPRKRTTRAARVTEEAQNVGADVVPEGTIEVEVSRGGQAPPPVQTDVIIEPQSAREPVMDRAQSLLSDWDLHLFNEGTHLHLWQKLGSHILRDGVMFGVWAPNADRVSVIGDFNDWDPQRNGLEARGASGLWEGFVPGIGKGAVYKFHIVSRFNNYRVDKADPFGVLQETPPKTASVVWDLDYEWNDEAWMRSRRERNAFTAPVSIY